MKKILVFVNKLGRAIDSVERKALTPRGVGLIINAFVLMFLVVGCSEKLENPYSKVSEPVDTLTKLTPFSLSQVDSLSSSISSSEVKSPPREPVIEIKEREDTLSGHTELITKTIVDTFVNGVKKKPLKKAPISPTPEEIAVKPKSMCPCESKLPVTAKSTVWNFSKLGKISVDEFMALQKEEVWLNKKKYALKQGIYVCLKRQKC